MKNYKLFLCVLFLTCLHHLEFYGQKINNNKNLILIGDVGPAASPVLPLVFFSDSSDLVVLKNDVKNKYFLERIIESSVYRIDDAKLFEQIDSVIYKCSIKYELITRNSISQVNPLLNYIRYFNGKKVFQKGIHNNAIAIEIIKNLISIFDKKKDSQNYISILKDIKRKSLYCYD